MKIEFMRGAAVAACLAVAAGCGGNGADAEAGSLGESPGESEEMAAPAERQNARAPDGDRYEVQLVGAEGEVFGTAAIEEEGDGVLVFVNLSGLEQGEYGFHFHETGTCEPPDFQSAGGHFASDDAAHGFQDPDGPHAGDLPNVVVDADGSSRMEIFNARTSLAELRGGDGAALVLHAEPDDYETDPDGDAGPRIACGVISPR